MGTRKCRECKELKPLSDFAWRHKDKGERHTICKECVRKHDRMYYLRSRDKYIASAKRGREKAKAVIRAYIFQYLCSHPCKDCGESDPVVLEFDHVRGEKDTSIANCASKSYSLVRVKTEVAKCEVRCANCHRRRHAKERGFWIVGYVEDSRA